MIEHRLIERMIRVLEGELAKARERSGISPVMIDTAVDFFRTYADRTHHGKEEDILFRDLDAKLLADEHRRTMGELLQEHAEARKKVASLVEARDRYVRQDPDALAEIMEMMEELILFYPVHIEKEDKHFFRPCMEYFSREELDEMLDEFQEFDRKMIHEKYRRVVEAFEDL